MINIFVYLFICIYIWHEAKFSCDRVIGGSCKLTSPKQHFICIPLLVRKHIFDPLKESWWHLISHDNIRDNPFLHMNHYNWTGHSAIYGMTIWHGYLGLFKYSVMAEELHVFDADKLAVCQEMECGLIGLIECLSRNGFHALSWLSGLSGSVTG